MIIFKLGDKDYFMPTKWSEVTFSQFTALQISNGNKIDVLSILTGIDKADLERTKIYDIDEKLEPFIKFIYTKYDEAKATRLGYINYKGVRYELPDKLEGKYTLGQKIALHDKMVECVNLTGTTYNIMPFACAVYLQPIVQKKEYSTDEAEKMAIDFKECKIDEVYSFASFFLRKLIVSSKERQTHSSVNIPRRRSLLEYLRCLFSRNSQQSIHLQEVM